MQEFYNSAHTMFESGPRLFLKFRKDKSASPALDSACQDEGSRRISTYPDFVAAQGAGQLRGARAHDLRASAPGQPGRNGSPKITRQKSPQALPDRNVLDVKLNVRGIQLPSTVRAGVGHLSRDERSFQIQRSPALLSRIAPELVTPAVTSEILRVKPKVSVRRVRHLHASSRQGVVSQTRSPKWRACAHGKTTKESTEPVAGQDIDALQVTHHS